MVDIFTLVCHILTQMKMGLKNVTSLEGVNPVFCLFDYLIVWICPSLPTKDVHTEALACIYEGAMRADLKKKKKNETKLNMENHLQETWFICLRAFYS